MARKNYREYLQGDKVRLKIVPIGQTGLLSRFRRLPGLNWDAALGSANAQSLGEDLISAIEVRALWSRFGL